MGAPSVWLSGVVNRGGGASIVLILFPGRAELIAQGLFVIVQEQEPGRTGEAEGPEEEGKEQEREAPAAASSLPRFHKGIGCGVGPARGLQSGVASSSPRFHKGTGAASGRHTSRWLPPRFSGSTRESAQRWADLST